MVSLATVNARRVVTVIPDTYCFDCLVVQKDSSRSSPPLPAQRGQSRNSRGGSADVLNQLARLKQQLANEGKRIEVELKVEHKEPEVFDPRLFQRPDMQPGPHVDVVDVRRDNNPQAMQDFNKLKAGRLP